MPAAAVIPALIAYIKVVAVKARSWISACAQAGRPTRSVPFGSRPTVGYSPLSLTGWRSKGVCMGATLCISLGFLLFYFEQIRVFKAGNRALNTSAWDNGTGLGS